MRMLHVESDTRIAKEVRAALSRHDPSTLTDWVGTRADAIAHLESDPSYDVVLVAVPLADGDGIELIDEIRRRDYTTAVVASIGVGNDEAALLALKAGADDYVVTRDDYLARLSPSLHGAHRRFRAEQLLRSRLLRVLYAEDEPDDVALTTFHLQRNAPHVELQIASSASEALRALEGPDPAMRYDVLLLDYRLPGMTALEMLKHLRERRHTDIPVVVVTGLGDEDVALQALKLGAADYLVKSPGYLHRLVPALERAFYSREIERNEAQARRGEERLHALVSGIPEALYVVDDDGRVQFWSEGAQQLYGYTSSEMIGESSGRLYGADGSHETSLRSDLSAARSGPLTTDGWRLRKSGEMIWTRLVMSLIASTPGQHPQFCVVSRDVGEERRRDRALEGAIREAREGRERLRYLSRRIFDSQEAERGRLAYELRERVAQSLVAARLGLEAMIADSDEDGRTANGALCRASLDDAVSRLDDLAVDLRPALLDDLGLEAAVRWLLGRECIQGVPRWRLTVRDLRDRIPAPLERACFRMIHAAVRNVIHHADATMMHVDLAVRGLRFYIDVRDDGVGFDVEQVLHGNAHGSIPMMHERTLALGGRFTVRSVTGGGTHVSVVIPLSIDAP